MRRIRIYCDSLNIEGETVLDKKNAHYLQNVLRCNQGDEIEILTAQHKIYVGKIYKRGKTLTIRDCRKIEVKEEGLPVLNLFVGLIKGSSFDLLVEKASELGATSVTPIYCEYSSGGRVTEERIKRFSRIALSSALQCRRLNPLKINRPENLSDILHKVPEGNNIYLSPLADRRLIDENCDFTRPFNIFSGPEGGFSNKEINEFENKGFYGLSLGPNILRAETIPLVICSIILYEYFRRNR